jgi:hypothetical protein
MELERVLMTFDQTTAGNRNKPKAVKLKDIRR